MTRVLITGTAGFIGFRPAKLLLAIGQGDHRPRFRWDD
jgi:hypothetical protein